MSVWDCYHLFKLRVISFFGVDSLCRTKTWKVFCFVFCHEFKTSDDLKTLPSSPWTRPTDLVHGLLYRPVHRPPLRVPMKTIMKMILRDLTYRLFVFFFTFMSKKTDNLANLCIHCRLPIASAILFGLILLVFSHLSQTSKIRHAISPFLSRATMDNTGHQISWKYISVIY